jgi:hypothetical protein
MARLLLRKFSLATIALTAIGRIDGDCQRLATAIRLVLEKAAAVEQERPVATLTPPAQPEADKPSAETPSSLG